VGGPVPGGHRAGRSGFQHWQAARIGSSATFDITADTPEELNNKLGENYRQWMRDSQRHNQ
jgi:hypothetical protein